jgi:hypothetical protein
MTNTGFVVAFERPDDNNQKSAFNDPQVRLRFGVFYQSKWLCNLCRL